MNTLLMILALMGDPATCPMHAKHTATPVDQRGDKVMGFSHEKTKHTFRLLPDGGAIEVRANEAGDLESVKAIRAHLTEIAGDFSRGDFAKPEEIHARAPEGVAEMKALGDRIRFAYEEIESGGRVRITTAEPKGVEAAHQFLRFQVDDHHTGDPKKVE
jgi:hypothetical protein